MHGDDALKGQRGCAQYSNSVGQEEGSGVVTYLKLTLHFPDADYSNTKCNNEILTQLIISNVALAC